MSTGGMGEVLLGRRRGALGFEKLVAIKTIRGDLVERADFRAMFLDEARLVARMDHPTICQVYDFGEEGKALFITMEYVAGVGLSQLLRAGRAPMPPGPAARIVAEILRGLHYAHEATDLAGEPLGVVHRDVSPQNLILTYDGRMKILDFGIAITKDRNAPDTQVGVLKGKPSYMAPEQLRAGACDRRSDLFAAGVVLYEILTGQKLFTRETALATALAVESDPIPPPSTIVPGLHPDLDAIVMRALARSPDDRFADARQMAEILERVALQIDPTSVQEFAERELADERFAHQLWLNEVLDLAEAQGGSTPMPPPESATGITDGLNLPGPPPEARPLSLRNATPALRDETTMLPPIGRGSGPRVIASATAVAVLIIGGGLYFASARSEVVPSEPQALEIIEEHPVPEVKLEAEAATISSGHSEIAEVEDALPAPAEGEAREKSNARRRARAQRIKASEAARVAKEELPVMGGGFLTVGAEPYALVRIDGADVGVTPIVRKKISAGSHEIELVSPDTGEVRLKKKVSLTTDEHQRITIP